MTTGRPDDGILKHAELPCPELGGDLVDAGIVRLISWMARRGFTTVASCQGYGDTRQGSWGYVLLRRASDLDACLAGLIELTRVAAPDLCARIRQAHYVTGPTPDAEYRRQRTMWWAYEVGFDSRSGRSVEPSRPQLEAVLRIPTSDVARLVAMLR